MLIKYPWGLDYVNVKPVGIIIESIKKISLERMSIKELEGRLGGKELKKI